MKKIYLFIFALLTTMLANSQSPLQKAALTGDQNPGMEVNISPNLTRNNFIVQVNSEDVATAQISLYNMLGEQLSVRAVELQEGRNNFSYPGINLLPGNYFVSVKTNKGSIVKKVTIE